MGQNNIIELNGKKYDALTGALLGESKVRATPGSRAALQRHGRNIDGFVRQAYGPAPVVIKPSPVKSVPAGVSKSVSASVLSAGSDIKKPGASARVSKAQAVTPHQPQRPKTLMRHVVKKPDVKLKPAIKTTSPSEIMARPVSTLAKPLEKKLSASQVNPVRLARSRQVAKSHHIRRFNRNARASHSAALEAVAMQGAATPQAMQPLNRTAAHTAAARPIARGATTPAIATNASAPVARKEQSVDIFEAALAHATSHEQKTPPQARYQASKKRRLVNAMAGLAAFLVIAGFVGYLNRPAIELRIASMRAGFHAEMPSYKPTGYALEGTIKSSEGKVAMHFRSGDSTYTITQQASDWNSATLLDQAAEQRGAPARTIQSKGRTIYLYSDTTATWVNGGVRYEISGDAPLDAGELVSLATSM